MIIYSRELMFQFKRPALYSQVEGGWAFNFRCVFSQAMGFRAVTDLSDYSVPELLALIEQATKILKDKITGTSSSAASVCSSSGVSVIEPDATSSTVPVQRNAAGLRSPFTCEFHCKFCNSQCCRPEPHKNHACVEHRKWR